MWEQLEEQFENLCHIVGNKTLSNSFIIQDMDNRVTAEKLRANNSEIAKAMLSFKEAFVSYRKENHPE